MVDEEDNALHVLEGSHNKVKGGLHVKVSKYFEW